MSRLSRKDWNKYVERLSAINKTAGRKMQAWIDKHGTGDVSALVSVAFALVTRYGEAASSAACQMYDEVARAQKAHVPPAEPKATQGIQYVESAIRNTLGRAPGTVPSTVSEMVKRTGAETTLKNAQRDGAYFAWIPSGDACAYCEMLASNGWRKASRKTIQGDHADHIHKNCNCEFAISFDGPGDIEGYDPEQLADMFKNAEGNSWKDKVNAVRRAQYATNRDAINAQKRAAYARRHVLPVGKPETTFKSTERAVKESVVFTSADGHSIIMSSKQMGKKLGIHCRDYGKDPRKSEDREWVVRHIADILRNYDLKVPGVFRGQGDFIEGSRNRKDGPVWFYIKGEDVVVVNGADEEFVTILKGGARKDESGNKRVQGALHDYHAGKRK